MISWPTYLLGKKLLRSTVWYFCQCFRISNFIINSCWQHCCVKFLSKATFCLLLKAAVIGRLKVMFFSSGRITSEESLTSEIRTTESYTHSHRKLKKLTRCSGSFCRLLFSNIFKISLQRAVLFWDTEPIWNSTECESNRSDPLNQFHFTSFFLYLDFCSPTSPFCFFVAQFCHVWKTEKLLFTNKYNE